MAREIPEVVRAAAGLAATVLDEARKLPETLPGLPVRLIGQALQTSLRLQQQYSGLVARGDELFTGLRGDAEPGMATFDDDLPAPPPPAGTPAPRSSAFDRVADLPEEADADELADVLADDLAVDALPIIDADELTDDVAVAVLAQAGAAPEQSTTDEITPAEVAALPDDPAADAITAVVDELADDVADEIAEEIPDVVPDEVLADLTADTVADVAEDEQAIEEAVTDEVIADAVLTDGEAGGTPPADTADAIDEAAEELVDLGGPEAAESVTPGSPVTDSAASDPLVPAEPVAGEQSAVTTPVEGYDTFSIPALRGHLRSYPAETVADLLDYERATRARAPYVTLLQNRLEKLSADRG
ncbi:MULTISPECIES: lipid droplet-associated protein [unclassified Modestobacter]